MNARRTSVIFGMCLVAFYFLYVAGATFIFQLNLPEKWSASSQQFRVSCRGGGYSLWPGVIHLKDVEIVIEDYNITMLISADEAHLDVGLLSLLSGTAHIEDMMAKGGRLKLRHRVHDAEREKKRIAAYPTIPGFDRPLEYPKTPRIWGIQRKLVIDHIRAEATDLWFLEYRTQGKFVAEGSFVLDDQVRVHPCWMKAEDVHVFVQEQKMIDIAKWELSVSAGPFPRRLAKVPEVLAHLNVDTVFTEALVNLELSQLYQSDPSFGLSGAIALGGTFQIAEGKAKSGTLNFGSDKVELSSKGPLLDLSTHGQIAVERPGLVRAFATMNSVGDEKWASVKDGRVELQAEHTSLTKWTLDEARLSMASLQTKRPELLRRLSGSLESPLITVQKVSGDASYKRGAGTFTADLHSDLTWFSGVDESWGLSGTTKARCSQVPPSSPSTKTEHQRPQLSCATLSLRADPLVLTRKKDSASLPLNFVATEFLTTTDLKSIDSTWDISGRNPKSFALHALGDKFLVKVGLRLLPLDDWGARLHLNRSGTTIAGNLEQTAMGGVSVEGRFVFDQALTSAWSFTTPLGRYGVRQKPQSTKVHPLVRKGWLQTCEAHLGGDC